MSCKQTSIMWLRIKNFMSPNQYCLISSESKFMRQVTITVSDLISSNRVYELWKVLKRTGSIIIIARWEGGQRWKAGGKRLPNQNYISTASELKRTRIKRATAISTSYSFPNSPRPLTQDGTERDTRWIITDIKGILHQRDRYQEGAVIEMWKQSDLEMDIFSSAFAALDQVAPTLPAKQFSQNAVRVDKLLTCNLIRLCRRVCVGNPDHFSAG